MKFIDPRLFRYARSSRGFIALAVLNAIFLTCLSIAQAVLIARLVIAAFQYRTPLERLHSDLIILILIFFARSFLSYFSDQIVRKTSNNIRFSLRKQIFSQGIQHGAEINLKYGYGKLSLLATRGLQQLEPYFNKFIPQFFIALIIPIILGITIALHDLLSGVIIILTIPLIPLFGILIGRYTEAAMMKKWRTMGVLSAYVVDLFNGLLTLKTFNRSKRQVEQIEIVGTRYRTETMKVLRISFVTSLVLEIIATLSVALLAVAIGLRLVDGSISLYTGLVVLLLAPEVYWPIRQVSTQFHASAEGVQASHEIFDILDIPTPENLTLREPITGLSWSEILVNYGDRNQIKIPAGRLDKGTLTVLIGPSGSGKTTLLNILLGVVSPDIGRVSLHSATHNEVLTHSHRDNWYQQVAWVSQDPQFPAGKIIDSLRQINQSIKDSELFPLMKALGLSDELLSYSLGDNNSGVSLGQLRRLAILRALISGRPILILDEPTASLDSESEEAVFKLLRESTKNGTLVFVSSHSPEIIPHADNVISMAIGVR